MFADKIYYHFYGHDQGYIFLPAWYDDVPATSSQFYPAIMVDPTAV